MNKKNLTLKAKRQQIAIIASENQDDFISLTNIAKYKSDDQFIVINNWMKNMDTIEFVEL